MLKEIAEEKPNMADTQGKEDVEKDSVSQKKSIMPHPTQWGSDWIMDGLPKRPGSQTPKMVQACSPEIVQGVFLEKTTVY